MKHILITAILMCHAALVAALESLEDVPEPEALQP